MAAVTPDIGQGAAVTFSSGFLARATDLNWTGISRTSTDATTLATTGGRPKVFGKIYDPGALECTLQHDTDATIPIIAAAETVTLTWDDGQTMSASGALTEYSITPVTEDGIITASATITFSGNITGNVTIS